MDLRLSHPMCVLNISDDTNAHFCQNEYRSEYYTVMLVKNMHTGVVVNNIEYIASGDALFFLTPFQAIYFSSAVPDSCTMVQFNVDLFCLEKHDSEIGCNGILFNSVFEPPMLSVTTEQMDLFCSMLQKMGDEISQQDVGSVDMLESYVKQLLIQGVRIKKAGKGMQHIEKQCAEHGKIMELRQLIDKHYKEERKLKFYAEYLYLSESGLHKLISKHIGKTFTELLYDKIIIDAKKQLYVTNNSVKEISYDLGFNDPAYFNRFFKKQCTITPEHYRKVMRNSAIQV